MLSQCLKKYRDITLKCLSALLKSSKILSKVPFFYNGSIDNMTPYNKLFENYPNISHLCVSRCICFVYNYDALSNKLDGKSIRYIFLGYDEARKD